MWKVHKLLNRSYRDLPGPAAHSIRDVRSRQRAVVAEVDVPGTREEHSIMDSMDEAARRLMKRRRENPSKRSQEPIAGGAKLLPGAH